MTSVAGHLFNTDFPDELQDWDAVDPAQLFDAPVEKRPTKATVLTSLRNAGKGYAHLSDSHRTLTQTPNPKP